MRVGFGFDAHQLVEGRKLQLGGISIDFNMGLLGHSDGDVVLHALADAILGAAASGDIGTYFKDTDPLISGIESSKILEFALSKANEKGFSLVNIDLVIVADKPKLEPIYQKLRDSISHLCSISTDRVSVKAKTTEGTGINGSAIACYASILMDEQ
ncbi:MAG: 2-C-methyl-D-erythritol 2,4-cyclodiphosphate synthase [Candidatus Kryptoniota bacterium]